MEGDAQKLKYIGFKIDHKNDRFFDGIGNIPTIMFRRMIRPIGFKTFIINYLKYPSRIPVQKVYGFDVNNCQGPFVINGLQFIKSNLDSSIHIPDINKGQLMMSINGRAGDALTTHMKETNVIYPIIGTPFYNNTCLIADDPNYCVETHANGVIQYKMIA
jgi:hypothetical protein|tara:strand:+ start:59 stop:538 length:480 start_codon:yes stop_codon:yes gene_type:complete